MKYVLFDLDGTVADTERLKAKAISRAIAHFGGAVSEELYKEWMGKSWEVVTTAFFEAAGVGVTLKEFDPIFREHYLKLLEEELREHNSFSSFAKFLKSRGTRMALVSSGVPWMIQKTLTQLNIASFFEVIVSADDVLKHKPDPEPYLQALAKLGAAPFERGAALNQSVADAVVFEDSESGFLSAHRAGLRVYGVKHPFNASHDFSLCAGIFKSFEECLEWEVFN